MKLSPIPDWASRRQLAIAALAVWLIAWLTAPFSLARLARTVGDTDDAMRLVLVRDLAAGRGWFDQHVTRLQPPQGAYMHWSRLVDGGEAALLKAMALVLPADQAETAMRLAWPVLWVLPLTFAALMIARRLGGGRAVFLGVIAVALAFHTSSEFQPGRVDHHSLQITCCLWALAAAVQPTAAAWAVVCGLASAAGLAVGLEALPFLGLIGAALGCSWALGRSPGRVLATYGLALGASILALHAIQTPPDRWLTPACDALAFNLVAGLATAGVGLALSAAIGARSGWLVRFGLLALAGGAAAAVYVGLEPLCLHGPMAAVDPVLKTEWLLRVREMTPWLTLLAHDPSMAISMAAPVVLGAVGWLWLGRRAEMRRETVWLLTGVLLIVAIALTLQASRYVQYALWFSAPVTAAAMVDFAGVAMGGLLIPAVGLLVVLTMVPGLAVDRFGPRPGSLAKGRVGEDRCSDTAAFGPLAKLPPGLVLSEIDAGPYVLANTPHAALQAPYHRMTWGIKAARSALGAGPSEAEAQVRALHVIYVLDCPAHAHQSDRQVQRADSLQRTLDAGRAPAWLEPLSPPGAPLQIFRVR